MISLRERCRQPELLDSREPDPHLLHENLRELEVINNWLGGHSTTLNGIEQLISPSVRKLTVTDIGCGGGDTLLAVARWAKRKNIEVRLRGIDHLPEAIAWAESRQDTDNIEFICGDVFSMPLKELQADILLCSMMMHHLYDDKLTRLLDILNQSCRFGFVINDLHRHALAYHSISMITRVFSRSALVKNDAPLSVRKGFSARELHALFSGLGLNYSLRWKWAFRYLVTVKMKNSDGRNI